LSDSPVNQPPGGDPPPSSPKRRTARKPRAQSAAAEGPAPPLAAVPLDLPLTRAAIEIADAHRLTIKPDIDLGRLWDRLPGIPSRLYAARDAPARRPRSSKFPPRASAAGVAPSADTDGGHSTAAVGSPCRGQPGRRADGDVPVSYTLAVYCTAQGRRGSGSRYAGRDLGARGLDRTNSGRDGVGRLGGRALAC
jgi:hypothetical protein